MTKPQTTAIEWGFYQTTRKGSGMDAEILHELFEYRDGRLYWKTARSNRIKAGDEAGTASGHKYKRVFIDTKKHYVHRIIFMMAHGYLPEVIDHIDRNTQNNRIENLRPSNKTLNGYNRGANKNSKTGVKGVTVDKRTGKYIGEVWNKGKKQTTQSFCDINDAINAVNEIRAKLSKQVFL